ncbi:MAG: TetR/AcrR family transcriptional regulator [Bacteroidales bacterium]|nr:TetR/AcrR family transcriptional regulator [Bacteroidales bacterium]HRX31025.1 TetR/AcrR family transcriptional regulator [Tenuifilaceae bacterium]
MNDTREYIIDKAYGLFLNRSYEAVSISEISKAIGFTKGALYHHFKNKEELFKAVIDKYLFINTLDVEAQKISLAEYINESIQYAENIMSGIMGNTENFMPINYISLFIDAIRHYPSFYKEKETLINGELEKIKVVLNNAVVSGEIRNDIDVTVTALNYISIMYGIASNLVQNNSLESAISVLKLQFDELYKLLKV